MTQQSDNPLPDLVEHGQWVAEDVPEESEPSEPAIPPKLLEHVAEALYLHDCHSDPPCSWADASTVSKDYYRGVARVALAATLEGATVDEELQIEADDADGNPQVLRWLRGEDLARARLMTENYATGFKNVALYRHTMIKLPWALVLDDEEE
jgi:hypothetical protein